MAYKLNYIKPPEKRLESLGQIIRKTIGLWSGSKGSISHRKLVLVSIAKWKRPVKLVYEIGQKGKGAICAPNRQNESSPIGSIGLWSGFHFAMETSTSTKVRAKRGK